MIDLGTYKDRFAESGQRVLEHAIQESRRRDQNYIAVEHILNALSVEEADLFNSTMRDLALDPRSVKVLIEKRLENSRYQNVNKAHPHRARDHRPLQEGDGARPRAGAQDHRGDRPLHGALAGREQRLHGRLEEPRREPRNGGRERARPRPHARAGGGAVQEEVRAAALPQALRRLSEPAGARWTSCRRPSGASRKSSR